VDGKGGEGRIREERGEKGGEGRNPNVTGI